MYHMPFISHACVTSILLPKVKPNDSKSLDTATILCLPGSLMSILNIEAVCDGSLFVCSGTAL